MKDLRKELELAVKGTEYAITIREEILIKYANNKDLNALKRTINELELLHNDLQHHKGLINWMEEKRC